MEQNFIKNRCQKRYKAQCGDVFVVQPYPNVYVYGKILAILNSGFGFYRGMSVAAITRTITTGINLKKKIDTHELMFPLILISEYEFRLGNMLKIRTDEVTESDFSDYGFRKQIHYNETGFNKEGWQLKFVGDTIDVKGWKIKNEPSMVLPLNDHYTIERLQAKVYKYFAEYPELIPPPLDEDMVRATVTDELASKKQAAQQVEIEEFNAKIAPFQRVEGGLQPSLCLDMDIAFCDDLFNACGLEGSGHDWEALAKVFIREVRQDFKKKIKFDSENGMFCALGSKKALGEFALAFRELCNDESAMIDLLSRAEHF